MIELDIELRGLEEAMAKLQKLEDKLEGAIADALMGMRSLLLQRFRATLPRQTGKMQASARIERRGNSVALIADAYYPGQVHKVIRKIDANKLVSDAELAAAIKKAMQTIGGSGAAKAIAPKKTFL